MTEAMLEAILLEAAFEKTQGEERRSTDGRKLTVYLCHGGASLTIGRIEALSRIGSMLMMRNDKGERHFADLQHVLAVAVEAGAATSTTRRPGFLT